MAAVLQLCSDGVFIPADQLCPPPYSGPYYSDSENINIPYPSAPDGSNGTNTTTTSSSHQGSPSSISTGALAGIILVILAFFFALICAFAIKFGMRLPIRRLPLFRPRSSLRRQQSDMNGDDQELNGNDVVVDVMNATYGRGLDEKLLSLLPVSVYVPNHHGNNTEGKVPYMTECAVCLNLFEEKDIVRVLPTCNHTFHIYCIDRWFESHVNCPLCRETITLQSLIQLSDTTAMTGPHQQGRGENPHDLNYNTQGRDRYENDNDANQSAEGEMCQNGDHNSPDVCQNGDHHSANTGLACHDNVEPEQADHAPEVLGISSCEKGALVS